jgi:sugar transferase (PEP-CTERM/EpsH1 system associated)
MRILCLTSRLPYPPNRGDRLRAFHFIEHLSRQHELSLVSFVAGESERGHVAALEAHCQAVHVVSMSRARSAISVASNLWRPDPLQVLYYRSWAMQRLIAEVTTRTAFDAAYVHLFRMAPYVERLTGMYRIVDLTDVISKEISLSLPYRGLASRLLYRMEKPRIARYERWVAQNLEETWLISEADRKLLAAACPGTNIRVVPNGVDLALFQPTGQTFTANSLIFVGHMGVFHNIDAAIHLATDVLPLVQEQIPDCRLKIVGADPDPQIQRLGHDPSVTVTGFVPDLNEQLNQAAVFVAPLRFAAGIQNKVLEAMAAGTPVVTTSLINEGLGAQPDHELVVADDAASTAQEIVLLLQDQERREQIARAGRQFVVRKYSWAHAVERVGAIEDRLRCRVPGFPSGRNVL